MRNRFRTSATLFILLLVLASLASPAQAPAPPVT